MKQDAHKILGIPADADKETIRKAYLARAREWHPDVSQLDPIQATARFQSLNSAYDMLKNPHQSAPHEATQTYSASTIRFASESFYAYRKRMQARRNSNYSTQSRRRRKGLKFGFMGFGGGR
ncbi:MAG TPA: J domain-containing protein [Bacteroidetes bacterium]|nr:J domain-containing protein [Bacteroidota bacterium]